LPTDSCSNMASVFRSTGSASSVIGSGSGGCSYSMSRRLMLMFPPGSGKSLGNDDSRRRSAEGYEYGT
jgi:hypothetical protein